VIAHDGLGMAYDGSGNFIEAVKTYMRALRIAPNSADTRTNLGMTYYNLGSYAEATKAFNQALQIDPTNVQAHYGLGLVYIDLRYKDLALNQVEALENSERKDLAASLLERVERYCE
jgi:Flp pilus assembly protein TadD